MTPNLRQLFPLVGVDFTTGTVYFWLRYERGLGRHVQFAALRANAQGEEVIVEMEDFTPPPGHVVKVRRFGSTILARDMDTLAHAWQRTPLTFGVDYDKTFTADPEVFRALVRLMRKRGHIVVMVSQRCAKYEAEMREVIQIADLPIVFANGHTKRAKAAAEGYFVDIWVEDNPFSIHTALSYRGCNEQET